MYSMSSPACVVPDQDLRQHSMPNIPYATLCPIIHVSIRTDGLCCVLHSVIIACGNGRLLASVRIESGDDL